MSNRITFDDMTYEVNLRDIVFIKGRFWDNPKVELTSDEGDLIRCSVLSRSADGTYLFIDSRKPIISMINMKKQDIVDYAKETFNVELDINKKKAGLINDVEELQRQL